MCPGGTKDVLSCLHAVFWPAVDSRSICIHKCLSCTPWEVKEGEERERGGLSNLGSLQNLENNLSSLFQPHCKPAYLFISLCNGQCLPRQVPVGDLGLEETYSQDHPTPHHTLRKVTSAWFNSGRPYPAPLMLKETVLRRLYTRKDSSLHFPACEPGDVGRSVGRSDGGWGAKMREEGEGEEDLWAVLRGRRNMKRKKSWTAGKI